VARQWELGTLGLLLLPSGRSVRGRALRGPRPDGQEPDYGLYLSAERPDDFPWPSGWVRWRDFRTPTDPGAAREALLEAWRRAAQERVEVACGGGRGRTGTALACLAVIDGVPAVEAVSYVRRHYHPKAVETPWQRRYVSRFPGP
jgi:protein-tyrosine phosphatase